MEAIAITLLAMILVVGGFAFFIFLQFLTTVRENRKLYKQIMEKIAGLQRQVDGIARVHERGSEPEQTD